MLGRSPLTGAENRGVDEHFGALTTELGVSKAVCVGKLMDQGSDLPVCGSARHHDLAMLDVAPAAGSVVGQVAHLDAVAECGGMRISGAIRWWWLSPVIGSAGGVGGTGSVPGIGSVPLTSHTVTVLKNTRLPPVSSPCSLRSLTVTGARIRMPSPLRGTRLSCSHARKPAT